MADSKAHRANDFVLIALAVTVIIELLDRQLMNLFIDPLRHGIGLSDGQVSLLLGVVYSGSAAVVALPVAHLVDHLDRKVVLVISLVICSVTTIAFGLAGNFATLLIARAALAVGEVALFPAAISLIRMAYPPEQQASRVGVLSVGIYLGAGLALVLGGLGSGRFGHLAGGLAPWRGVFVWCGLAGFPAALLVVLIGRRNRAEAPVARSAASWRAYFGLVALRRIEVSLYILAYNALTAVGLALTSWTPTLFMRSHGWSSAQIGVAYGVEFFACGTLGAWGSGACVSWLARRGTDQAVNHAARMVGLLMGAAGIGVGCAANAGVGLVFAALSLIACGAMSTLGQLGFQAMFPAAFTARSVAMFSTISLLIGGAIGPTIVPLAAQWLHSGNDLGPALAIVSGAGGLLAFVSLTLITRRNRAATSTELEFA